ncbi:MAG: hypothetical protein HY393_01505 [Candidatus Diapherotrites archaeon]|nr:hypothetical protein [Candidatus Diapherotrites archaeon]
MNIFVAAGTHPQPFDRLFRALDELKAKGGLKDEVFAQTGHSAYVPKSFESKSLLDLNEFNRRFAWADLVITHGGAGSILTAFEAGKKVMVVPRQKKFNEHTNDHQLELARVLAVEGKALEVVDIKDLEKTIEKARTFKPDLQTSKQGLVKAIREKLKEWERKK